MGLRVSVDAIEGHRADERPRRFELDGVEYRIYAWEREWRTPDGRYFVVRADGKRYILRCNEQSGEWTLESELDGSELFARPNIEIVTVERAAIRAAELSIASCEHCRPADADWLFCSVLDDVTGRVGNTEFVMSEPVKCPNCGGEIIEKTLVQLPGGIEVTAS